MPEFEIRAFQGLGGNWAVTLSNPAFVGTEILTASVGRGDTAPALLTVYPTWAPGQTTGAYGVVILSLSAANLGSLLPGSYTVIISLADTTAALSTGELEVYPSPGGLTTPYYRSLAPPAMAQSALPELTQQQIDILPLNLVAATRVIETYVHRPLVLDSYDHIIRPNGRFRIKLRARPIVEISRVSTDVVPGVTVRNGGTGSLDLANVQTITTSPQSLQIKTLVFNTVTNGITTAQPLTMASYGTFGQLATAINALGNGWGATTQPPLSGKQVADAFGSPGLRNALNQDIWIHTHDMPIGQYWDNPDQGWIEINEPIPGGFLIPNPRVERSDTRYWGIRCTYRAGYAVTAADIAMGYYPVPEDLQQTCVATAYNLIESVPFSGPVISQSVKDRSYTLRDAHSIIPEAYHIVLAKYLDIVF